ESRLPRRSLRPCPGATGYARRMRNSQRSRRATLVFALAAMSIASACSPLPEETPRRAASPERSAAPVQKVEVFVTDWCPYCQRLEAYLKSHQIQYVRFTIEKDAEAAREHRRLSNGGIPLTRIG